MLENRKVFTHQKINLGYDDLDVINNEQGRLYITPHGHRYPSITTVLSHLSEKSINEWRQKVGEEEANKISYRAASRGTAVHKIIEDYIDNVPEFQKGHMPNVFADFKRVQKVLDGRIGVVYAQEAALYSHRLELAGRVDCVADFDNQISIIDFKTSRKAKKREWIESYFIQESFYAAAWYELTNIPIKQIVTIISCDTGESQVFIENPYNYLPKLIEARKSYEEGNK